MAMAALLLLFRVRLARSDACGSGRKMTWPPEVWYGACNFNRRHRHSRFASPNSSRKFASHLSCPQARPRSRAGQYHIHPRSNQTKSHPIQYGNIGGAGNDILFTSPFGRAGRAPQH
ncbi:hypothetical protein V8C42DRAFT_314834 [Trichoderma barbatum]